jgi:hypothetical protein
MPDFLCSSKGMNFLGQIHSSSKFKHGGENGTSAGVGQSLISC